MRATERGLTVMELMVAAGLGLVILLAATVLYVFVLKKLFWIEEASDRQWVAMQAMSFLQADLRQSAPEGVRILGAHSLAVGKQTTPEKDGLRRWLEKPIVYQSESPGFLRAEFSTSDQVLDAPPTLLASDLSDALYGRGGWRVRSLPGCKLEKVEQQEQRVSVTLTFLQRRWDGGEQAQQIRGEVCYKL